MAGKDGVPRARELYVSGNSLTILNKEKISDASCMPCTHVIPNGAQRREESRVLSLLDLLQHGLQIPLFARNDIIGQHCLVESEFCQRITQQLQD